VTFFDEPMYQDGPISNAVNEVVGAGVPYFSSAANSNVISSLGRSIGSYEAASYRPIACPAGFGFLGTCHNFDAGGGSDVADSILLSGGRSTRLDLQWAQPRNGVTTDLDLYAVDVTANPDTIVAASVEDNFTSQKPFELLNLQNPTGAPREYAIVVNRVAGTASPRLKWVMLGGGGVTDAEWDASTNGDIVGPTIFGHNGAANAVSTAAVPFDDASSVERFSARGPVTLLFGPVGGSAPAAPLAAPQVLSKPDIAATDGGRTTFFTPSSGSVFRFFGTSAAAPHAAAVAALQLDAANGALTVDQLRAAQTSTASPVGSFGADAAGAGLINAAAAVGANPPQPPLTTITKRPKNKTTKRKATYRFTSNAPEATFKCKVDKRRYRPCDSTAKVKRLDFGKHKFSVKAVANGLTGPAAKDKFKRRR
ncbi:MAG: S8 family serine peptidase, partial [Solirubrobacterales bacterium]